jgi:hypothetical protein
MNEQMDVMSLMCMHAIVASYNIVFIYICKSVLKLVQAEGVRSCVFMRERERERESMKEY